MNTDPHVAEQATDPRLAPPALADFTDTDLGHTITSDFIATWVAGNALVVYRAVDGTVTGPLDPDDLDPGLAQALADQAIEAARFAIVIDGDAARPDPSDPAARAAIAAALHDAGRLPSPTTSRGYAPDGTALITGRYYRA